MKSHHLAVGALVVLTLVVIWHGRRGRDGFAPGIVYGHGPNNPYTVLSKNLGAMRGHAPSHAARGHSVFGNPGGVDLYHRSGANVTPRQIRDAHREAWLRSEGRPGDTNVEHFANPADEIAGHHAPPSEMDYSAYVEDLVLDPRTRESHRRWAEEMGPWSGVAFSVDGLEMESYLPFQGLYRPGAQGSAPPVVNAPMQLTEVMPEDLIQNSGKFRFN